jgi:Flp pilus assembly secretin CpaC/tetratricopeptide (TPR) repeat protein
MSNRRSVRSLFVAILSVILLSVVLCHGGRVEAAEKGQSQVLREVAKSYMEVGEGQLDRGNHSGAEQQFMRALDYQDYLTAEERSDLSDLLDKAHRGVLGSRKKSSKIEQAEPIKKIQDVKPVAVKSIASSKVSGRTIEIPSVGGVVEVPVDSSSYVDKGGAKVEVAPQIDYTVAQVPAEMIKPVETVEEVSVEVVEIPVLAPEVIEVAVVETAVAPVEQKSSVTPYVDIVNRRRAIVRGHTEAVIADAKKKVGQFVGEGEFEKARDALEMSRRLVEKNKLALGDELYKMYMADISGTMDEVSVAQTSTEKASEEAKRLKAMDVQLQFRQQMERDRVNRIADLMDKALTYQQQQRYEEALGQLETLLSIDPHNNQALIMKQTLEDMVLFRRQLEIERESNMERVDLLVETDASAIPFVEEMTHPKNWREIDAKRQPMESVAQDTVNVELYNQLDTVVNLSSFTPTMSFNDAIDILRKSVQPELPIHVLWRDIEEIAEVDQTTPINMDGLTAVPVGTALRLLLESVSSYVKLGYDIKDGVITIATEDTLKVELETRVYDVSVLLGQPADFHSTGGGGGGSGGSGGSGGRSGGGSSSSSSSGSGGSQSQDYSEYFEDEEESLSREELSAAKQERIDELTLLIQDTIEPDSWYEYGEGEGTINIYQNKKLIVMQSREVHTRIEKLLKSLRESLGNQVALEARFLVVGENFLEDIGLDVDFPVIDLGGKIGEVSFNQGSSLVTPPASTGILGSFGASEGTSITPSGQIEGGYGTVLDDLQVSFLLRATQAHRDSKTLNAPKCTVLSGESAVIRNQRTIRYPMLPEIGSTDTTFGGGGSTSSSQENEYGQVITGTLLSITPTITPDRKHVLLNITTELRSFLGFETTNLEVPNLTSGTGEIFSYNVTLPQTEISRVQTRVSVPDSGTLLLGGQKITAETDTEAGVPILSKIPILGRAFRNNSTIRDSKILLILVKPTIILQDEADSEALAELNGEF